MDGKTVDGAMADGMNAGGASTARRETEARFLDAAERLLLEVGYAGISTRRLAEEAGANHGLVHYYFGSMEELYLRVLERFTERLIARQRALYASEGSFLSKWRQAMRYLEEDRPYQKIWWELQSMAWNRPEFQERIARVRAAWVEAMRGAISEAVGRYGLDSAGLSTDAWIALVTALNVGLIHERVSGVDEGHAALLEAIDGWLTSLEARAVRREAVAREPEAAPETEMPTTTDASREVGPPEAEGGDA